MTEEIPTRKIREGYKISLLVVDRLLQDSELLLKKKRYSSSIPLSILALEEFSKILIFEAVSKQNKGLPKSIWTKLSGGGSHLNKLSLYADARKKILEIKTPKKFDEIYKKFSKDIGLTDKVGGKHVDHETELFQKLLPKLNSIKMKCFYLDYDFETEYWIYFDGYYKPEFKEALAKFLHLFIRILSFSHHIFSNLPKNALDYDKKELKSIRNSKDVKLLAKLQKQMYSKEYTRYFDMPLLMIFSFDELIELYRKKDSFLKNN